MSTKELQDILIHKIAAINDSSFLEAINTIIDTKSNSTIYKTTEEQKTAIQESIDKLENGEFFTNNAVESDIEKWLKEE